MIFVTVGTHEQQFNRLIEEIDNLVKRNIIQEDVFIQIGYSTYLPTYCTWAKFLSYKEMEEKITDARIVITHGGPASFLSVLEKKKTPIVVPRRLKYQEHVNDHQLDFSRKIMEKGYNIILVEDCKNLKKEITNYEAYDAEAFVTNNQKFNVELGKLISNLLGES